MNLAAETDPKTPWLDAIKWNEDGLVPVITQDYLSGRVLTHAWLNKEALALAQKEGRAVYWSRSRAKLWRKGEESGFIQKLHATYLDCDGDTVCFMVEQIGGIACHTGRESCFYRKLEDEQWRNVDPVLKDPKAIYAK